MKTPGMMLALLLGLAGLGGCSATHTAMNKSELDVQTSMSSTIWLDPVRADQRTVFLQIRNTSGHPALDVQQQIHDALQSRGLKITDDPQRAHYWLQANVLKVDRHNRDEDHDDHGFGAAIVGGGIGNQFGDGGGRVATTIAGAVVGLAVDAAIDDIEYVMITDLQIAEKTAAAVSSQSSAVLQQGNSGSTSEASSQQRDRKRYQTRVVSTANQANLELADATPLLVGQLVNAVSGLF